MGLVTKEFSLDLDKYVLARGKRMTPVMRVLFPLPLRTY